MDDKLKRIQEIEEEIKKTPYHKGTEHHIGKLKARIARLKEEILQKRTKRGGGAQSDGGFAVKKTGDATVILVGPPSVGKSSLLNKLTNAQSKVADYEFTTTTVIPGMMTYKGAKIQILDIPGLISGASQGRGRGKEIISVIRGADLILIMVDIFSLEKIKNIKDELYQAGLRLDETPPRIYFRKTVKGGLKIIPNIPLSKISYETIREIATEFKLKNAEIIIKEDISQERLIDGFLGNRVYLPYVIIVNKIDLKKDFLLPKEVNNALLISCQKNVGLEQLKEIIWRKLNLLRVYLKEKDKEADFSHPFILKKGESLKNLLEKISICNKKEFKMAKISGPGAKFPGQVVSLDFSPLDETIISFL